MDPQILESSRKAAERAEMQDDIECMADRADAISISSGGETKHAVGAPDRSIVRSQQAAVTKNGLPNVDHPRAQFT